MGMTRKRLGILFAALLVCLVAGLGLFRWHKAQGEAQRRESWALAFLQEAAKLDLSLAYGELPKYTDWYGSAAHAAYQSLDKLTEFPLDALLGAYDKLVMIRSAAPDQEGLPALFEELRPYFKRAFQWEPETAPAECLDRLEALEEKREELAVLFRRVDGMVESSGAGAWWASVVRAET